MSEIRPELIYELAHDIADEIVRTRRHLHRYPELSNHEHRTAAFIAQELGQIGIDCEIGVGQTTGIRAILHGQALPDTGPNTLGIPKPVIAIRADMDALPIHEATGLPFSSEHAGVMHACGHDAHMAMALGAARILCRLKQQFHGTVVFIFQPAEEKAPGGATTLIKAGVLEDPRPDLIIGQHINPELPAGKFGFRAGTMMASVDDFFITIHGSGGHGAMPQLCVDPITVSAQIINAVQLLVSRMADPRIPSVLTFGRIQGEGATNIIPGSVRLEGTFRTIDETWRQEALKRIERIVTMTAEAHHATATVEILHGYPVLFNEPELNGRLRKQATELVGPEEVIDLELFMGAEDFAYYGQAIPACFYNIGVGQPDIWNPPLHHAGMNLDETALERGSAMFAWLALSHLKPNKMV